MRPLDSTLYTMEQIGFYSSSLSWGGLEMNFIKFAVWINKRGYRVKIYCVEGSPIAHKLQTYDINVEYIQRNRKYYDFIDAYRIYKLIKKDNIKAIWIRDTRDLSTIVLAKIFSGNKFKIIYHQGMQIGVSKRDIFHTIRFSGVDIWITLLNYLESQIKTQTYFDYKKIRIIPLAVDLNQNIEEISQIQARKRFNLPSNKFIIGILGRISPHKGQLFLIEQLAKLRSQNLNVELLIVGESTRNENNEYETLLHKRVEEMNIREFVHFYPFTSEPEIFYRAIDLFVMASMGETFGTVTIEAMKLGVPVLGTNSSGTPEILENGNLGFLYKANDGNDFCEKVNWIINNPKVVRNKAILAKKNANYKYSPEVVCDQIEEVISQLNLTMCKDH